MKDKVTGRLENWERQQITKKEFIIWGNLHDEDAMTQRWTDGSRIHTSAIKNRSIKSGDIVQTRNSTYLLGKPREDIL